MEDEYHRRLLRKKCQSLSGFYHGISTQTKGSKRESKVIFRGGVDKYLCTGLDTPIMEPFEKGVNCIILHHSTHMKDS